MLTIHDAFKKCVNAKMTNSPMTNRLFKLGLFSTCKIHFLFSFDFGVMYDLDVLMIYPSKQD